MRVIIGYGNKLRGEDAFGVDVVEKLEQYELKDTKLISTFQLTPEIVLELLECDDVIFVDACFSNDNNYSLACRINRQNSSNLTHHIPPETIINILNGVYEKYPKYTIYSMLTNSFETISNKKEYQKSILKIINWITKR